MNIDKFKHQHTDILRGMHSAEESQDIPPPAEKHMGAVDEVRPTDRPTLPACLQEDFERDLPKFQKVIDSGKKTASELLATLSTKATFTEQQKAQILSLKPRAAAPPPAPEPTAPPPPAADDDGAGSWGDDTSGVAK